MADSGGSAAPTAQGKICRIWLKPLKLLKRKALGGFHKVEVKACTLNHWKFRASNRFRTKRF